MIRLMLVAGLACLCTAPAFAADDTAALKKAGILGTNWAQDCSKPAGDGNYTLSYGLTAKGVPAETLRSAPGNDKVRELRNVQVISPEWSMYTMTDTDGELIDILTRRTGDRKKSWWSVGKEGKAYIVDGKFPDSGEPPWFQLCK